MRALWDENWVNIGYSGRKNIVDTVRNGPHCIPATAAVKKVAITDRFHSINNL